MAVFVFICFLNLPIFPFCLLHFIVPWHKVPTLLTLCVCVFLSGNSVCVLHLACPIVREEINITDPRSCIGLDQNVWALEPWLLWLVLVNWSRRGQRIGHSLCPLKTEWPLRQSLMEFSPSPSVVTFLSLFPWSPFFMWTVTVRSAEFS